MSAKTDSIGCRRLSPLFSLALLLLLQLPGCKGAATYPQTIGTDSAADLKQRFGCLDVFDFVLGNGTYKALVFKLPKASESDSDYRVVFYKKVDGAFVRHGPESNLTNFERPTLLAGPEPVLTTTERRLGVRFSYEVTPDSAELVPSEVRKDGSLVGHPPPRR